MKVSSDKLFACAGLRDGEGVILIMTTDHCESFRLRLQLEGLSPEKYEHSGHLICLKTEDLLARLTADGILNEDLFKSILSRLIEQAKPTLNKIGRASCRERV